ncbi:uncharacterized protein K452DRAFT_287453 [Aplosporella prunicola CBS 121167]|uniref:Uncharacterized protein n=1 Tax=Aplosporella prunicola CBS 121167 TaxID=1176127 RepID=A0A6A6BG23_9PEZI|nr:uncharacterized protein K452DRAFT_287453 [Aplosporella prunicola CBS 121167]KAF2142235.1 hypothetical protein K452DRAFT_287453 [Aplosporella prunicola CBS 121167]
MSTESTPGTLSAQQTLKQMPEEKQRAINNIIDGIFQKLHHDDLKQLGKQIPAQSQAASQETKEIPDHGDAVQETAAQTTPEERRTGKARRFLGDTLVGRFARASHKTASSTVKMAGALSPWGDNNPVTLPNVRYRDAVLFVTFAGVGSHLVNGADHVVGDMFGADSFAAEVVSSSAAAMAGSVVIKEGVFQMAEQVVDKGVFERILPEEEKMLQTTNVKSLQVGVKHKLMGIDADLKFAGECPTRDWKACDKGWFCPYLFASARTPLVPRSTDFSMAQFYGPFLGGDCALAQKLLSESANVLSLCDPNPTNNIGTNRMIVLFTAISPYRANMWSTSRRPGCGTIIFHLFDGCPAVVLPVSSEAPICAWSPWTLEQMRAGEAEGYSVEKQHSQVCEWLEGLVSAEHVYEQVREKRAGVLGRAMSLVINGALALDKCPEKLELGKVDPARAGVVMFRY